MHEYSISVKNSIFVFPILPGSAEAQVTRGGIVNRILIAYFIDITSPQKMSKSVHASQSYSKPKVGRFLRHGVVVHYLADLQSVHGFGCYDNTARTQKCQRVLYSLYAWLLLLLNTSPT